MNPQTPVSDSLHRFLPTQIEGFELLAELALDMRWSWNHSTDKLWRQLDPMLWELTQNPWVVLQTVTRDYEIALHHHYDRKGYWIDELVNS